MSNGREETSTYTFALLGGRLCLDFTNTVGSHASETPSEHLHSYGDLLEWSRQAAVVTDEEAKQLERLAAEHPAEAVAVYEQAIALRETIYRTFSAVADGRVVGAEDMDALNRSLADALRHLRIVAADEGFAWDWTPDDRAFDRMLWPVVRSAAELLVSGELSRVRECSGDTCGWLFVDMSRNRSRRWCDMEDCGNRAKARRHYQRQRRGSTAES